MIVPKYQLNSIGRVKRRLTPSLREATADADRIEPISYLIVNRANAPREISSVDPFRKFSVCHARFQTKRRDSKGVMVDERTDRNANIPVSRASDASARFGESVAMIRRRFHRCPLDVPMTLASDQHEICARGETRTGVRRRIRFRECRRTRSSRAGGRHRLD